MNIGKVSVNINGDRSLKEIVEIAKQIEKSGIKIVWIGEFEDFLDPFEIAEVIADETSLKIGFGVLTINRSCKKILSDLIDLRNRYGDRFIVGIGAGKFKNPKKALNETISCAKKLKKHFKIFVGCSSPKITRESSTFADGILFNYVNPIYLKWITGYLKRDVFKVAYGPALILPSEFEEDLLIASCIVSLSSRKFIEWFKLEEIAKELESIDIYELINLRRVGRSISESKYSDVLFKHKSFLLRNFTVSGSLEDVISILKSILNICDHVVLADPFYRDKKSLKLLWHLSKI